MTNTQLLLPTFLSLVACFSATAAAADKAGVTTKLVPVENAEHNYKPEPKEATISPSRTEINNLELEWFRQHLK